MLGYIEGLHLQLQDVLNLFALDTISEVYQRTILVEK